MTITGANVLDKLCDYPQFAVKITVTVATNAGTATTTSATVAKFAQQPDWFYQKYLYAPEAAAAADQVRTILSHAESAGTTTFTFEQTANFGESDSFTAYILSVHPDTVYKAMQTAQDETDVICIVPLSHFPASAGMEGSAVDSDWTESNATDGTQTTASEVWDGAQSFLVTDSGSGGGYTQSALASVGNDKRIVQHVVFKSDTGTLKDQVLDASGNEISAITTSQKQWVYGRKVEDVGDVTQLRKRLTVVTASGAGDWQASWVVRVGETLFRLPSWVSDRHVIDGVSRFVFHEQVTDDSGDELYLADSGEPRALRKGVHWQSYKRAANATKRTIRILESGRKFMEDALFVMVRCPWSAPYGVSTLLSSYTSTSSIPLDLVVAKTLEVLGRNNKASDSDGWARMESEGAARVISLQVTDEMEAEAEDEEVRSGWAGAFR